MNYKTLRLEAANGITTINFTRPQTLNSITVEFMDELGAAIQEIGRDGETRVLILTGSGRGFCSGLDLALLGQVGVGMPVEDLRGIIRRWQAVYNALEDLPQVTIAAVNGICLGGGLEMILCCDFRMASTRAVFGLPEVKLGIVPDLGGIPRLARAVGAARAKEIVLRARNFSAMDALRSGLLQKIAEPGDLMGIARNWAEQLVKLPPTALLTAKRLVNAARETDLATALKAAEDAQMELLAGDEFRAAMQAARAETTGEPPDQAQSRVRS